MVWSGDGTGRGASRRLIPTNLSSSAWIRERRGGGWGGRLLDDRAGHLGNGPWHSTTGPAADMRVRNPFLSLSRLPEGVWSPCVNSWQETSS